MIKQPTAADMKRDAETDYEIREFGTDYLVMRLRQWIRRAVAAERRVAELERLNARDE